MHRQDELLSLIFQFLQSIVNNKVLLLFTLAAVYTITAHVMLLIFKSHKYDLGMTSI